MSSESPAIAPDGPRSPRSRPYIKVWWVLRVLLVAAVPWTLWPLVPLPLTVSVTALLAVAALVFLGPHDLPRRPLRVPGITVVVWDLVLLALGTACALVFTVHPLLLVGGLLTALVVRAPSWAILLNDPRHGQNQILAARWTAAGTAAVLAAGLASPLFVGAARDTLACARMGAVSGGGEDWPEARPGQPTGGTSGFVGSPLWSAEQSAWPVGGHGETVTFAGHEGLAVRAASDGRVLWHVDAPDPQPTLARHEPSYSPTRVHQVGRTVLVDYRHRVDDWQEHQESLLIAYDARTGRRTWCEPGVRDVRTDPGEPDRFVARVDAERSVWGLFDGAGSTRALLPLEDSSAEATQAVFSEGRATIWDPASFSGYDTGTGELLAHVRDLPHSAEGRDVSAFTHAGDVTVVSFKSLDWIEAERDENRHEHFGLIAYGAGGEELWNSVGMGPLEVGEPVVGTAFGGCTDGTLNRGFNGHFLTYDHPSYTREVVAVDASDGTVAWISSGEFRASGCALPTSTDGERLFLGSGAVVTAEGYAGSVRTEGNRIVATGNGAVEVDLFGHRTVFHAPA